MTDVRASALSFATEPTPDEMVRLAVAAAHAGRDQLQASLDALPAPVYLTDADGWVTFFNRACATFAGREPEAGRDRWCVTWKLYTEAGAPLPHEQCPMAVAVREKPEVRGDIAVAERPDGSRVMFTPLPTPIQDEDGNFLGAVNILVDVTDVRPAAALRAQAPRCPPLASSVTDSRTIDTLMLMAEEYEGQAGALGRV